MKEHLLIEIMHAVSNSRLAISPAWTTVRSAKHDLTSAASVGLETSMTTLKYANTPSLARSLTHSRTWTEAVNLDQNCPALWEAVSDQWCYALMAVHSKHNNDGELN